MNYVISSLDPVEIKRQTEKGRVASAKLYYEIRKDFSNRWLKFDDANSVLGIINYLMDECFKKMQRALDETPIESRCGDRATISTTGIKVSLRWIRYTQEDRDIYFQKYRGGYLNDYVTLDITFEIIDSYQHRVERNDLHKS